MLSNSSCLWLTVGYVLWCLWLVLVLGHDCGQLLGVPATCHWCCVMHLSPTCPSNVSQSQLWVYLFLLLIHCSCEYTLDGSLETRLFILLAPAFLEYLVSLFARSVSLCLVVSRTSLYVYHIVLFISQDLFLMTSSYMSLRWLISLWAPMILAYNLLDIQGIDHAPKHACMFCSSSPFFIRMSCTVNKVLCKSLRHAYSEHKVLTSTVYTGWAKNMYAILIRSWWSNFLVCFAFYLFFMVYFFRYWEWSFGA